MSIHQSAYSQIAVDVVIPVLNEAHILEKSVQTVRRFLHESFPYKWRLLIVDNASVDGTADIAARLSNEFPEVEAILLSEIGRGLALRTAWMHTDADFSCYMDVDLSTDISLVLPLVAAVVEEGYDIAIGSRLMKGAKIRRSLTREIISRIYNLFLKVALFTHISDAQCGFKAVSRKVIEQIIPEIQNCSWFFDTEMLVLAEKQGYRIKEIPVVWIEDPDSRVKLIRTSWENIMSVFRLRRRLWQSPAAAGSERRTAEKMEMRVRDRTGS